MAFTEDLDLFFDTNAFAVSATVKGEAVTAILDEGYEQALEIEGYNPELHCKTAELPEGVVAGDTVVVDGRTFKVVGIRKDLTEAITVLDLEYQSG